MANLKDTLVLGKLTATDSIIANKLIKNNGTDDQILMGDGSTKSFTTEITNAFTGVNNTLATKANIPANDISSSSYDIIVRSTSADATTATLYRRTQTDFIKDLKLSQVYNYKGTITWAQLLAVSSANVGDVYFISGADGNGASGQSWACKQRVTAATTSANYSTYWQSLGASVDLSGYVTKDTSQTISGYKTFSTGLKVATGNAKGVELGAAHITAEATDNGEVVLQGGHLRFGPSDWNYNVWGGLACSSKIIALGLADNVYFKANNVQTGGTLTLPGIEYLQMSGKEAIAAYDSWLRINEDATFSSGIYCGSNILRTDGQLQVGSSGGKFYAKSDGTGYFDNDLKAKGHVFAYNYGKDGNDAPAFVFDKNGGNYTGIGSHNLTDTIWFGAVSSSTFEWVNNYYQTWHFNGNVKVTKQFIRNGISSSWYNGRDNAMIRQDTSTGYNPILSLKTTNGTWEMGHYNSTNWHNMLLFNYKDDTSYNKGDSENTVVHAFKLTNTGALTVSDMITSTGSGERGCKAENTNGTISLLASTNRGLYDNTNSAWIIYRPKDTTNTWVPAWASKGGTANPVYFNSNGTPVACSSTVGGAAQPAYMSSGTITACSSTVGGASQPVYMSSGTITACSSTLGSISKPVFMSAGTITECSATVGDANSQPVYMSAGAITGITKVGVAYGGTGKTSWTANSMVYSSGTTTLANAHYVSSSKLAVNTTSAPSYNFYVNGSSYFNGDIYWKPAGNICCVPTGNDQEWSFDVGTSGYTGSMWHVWSSTAGASILSCYSDDRRVAIPVKLDVASLALSGSQIANANTGGAYVKARDFSLIRHTTSTTSSSFSALISGKTQSGEISCGIIHPYEQMEWIYSNDTGYTNNTNNASGYTRILAVNSAGAVTAASYNATSDKRLKNNIQDFTPSASILDLPLYRFDFINGAKNQIGCMAQDLQSICPEIVLEDPNNGYLSINESKIVYLLIDEIRKLKNQVTLLINNNKGGV